MNAETTYVKVKPDLSQFYLLMAFLQWQIDKLNEKRPQKKQQVKITYSFDAHVQFWADKEVAQQVSEYGNLDELSCGNHWILYFDPRYDREEILAYMDSFNR